MQAASARMDVIAAGRLAAKQLVFVGDDNLGANSENPSGVLYRQPALLLRRLWSGFCGDQQTLITTEFNSVGYRFALPVTKC